MSLAMRFAVNETTVSGLRWDAPDETAYPFTFAIDSRQEAVSCEIGHFLRGPYQSRGDARRAGREEIGAVALGSRDLLPD